MKTGRLIIVSCLLTFTLLSIFLISSQGIQTLEREGSAVAAPVGGTFTANLTTTDNLANNFGLLPIPAKIVFTYPEPPLSGPPMGDTNIWIMDADGSHQTQLTTYNGPDRVAAISPDGSKIIYQSFDGSVWSLWVMNIDGTAATQLPISGNPGGTPVWSPDGTRIVYSNDLVSFWELWIANADGSNPQRLTDNAGEAGSPSWSPDGQKIVYQSEPIAKYLDLYTINSDGTGQTLLVSASGTGFSNHIPAWSPDGTQIATLHWMAGSSSGPYDLWLMNADGSNGKVLVQDIDHYYYQRISWSADGNWLVFGKGGQIWKVRRDGTQLTQLTLEGGWEPWIGGDLSTLTCVPQSNEADIMMIVDRSGSMATNNELDDAKTAVTVFLSSTAMPPDQVSLVSFASDVTLDQVLTTDKASIISATQILSAAGNTHMDYALMTARTELTSTRHISTHSKVIILLTDGVQSPAGNDPVIAEANAAKAEGATLFTIGLGPDVDAQLLQQIASDPSDYYFAPTGAQLAAIYQQISGAIGCPEIGGQVYEDRDKNGVYSPGTDTPMSNVVISLAGSGVQQTTSQTDGHYVFANNSAGLYTVSLNLTSVPSGYIPVSPTVYSLNLTSTDNLANNFGLLPPGPGKIAFTRPQPFVAADPNIWIMDADGSNQTQITTYTGLDALPAISPDGSKIAYMSIRNNQQQLWLMNSDGSNPIQMPFNGNSQRSSWSPKGDQLAVTNDSQDWWEIWIINADGSNPHRITTTGPAVGEPSWSPDGKKIVYDVNPTAGYQDNYIVNSDGTGQPPQISNSASSGWSTSWPAWSPDGTQIAVGHWPVASSGPYDLWLMNTDGSNGYALVQNIDPMTYNRISWSADGNWLIFSKGGQIWKVRRDGTQLTQLTLEGGWEPSTSAGLVDSEYSHPTCVSAANILQLLLRFLR